MLSKEKKIQAFLLKLKLKVYKNYQNLHTKHAPKLETCFVFLNLIKKQTKYKYITNLFNLILGSQWGF